MDVIVPGMNEAQAAAWVALVSIGELLPPALDAQLTADAGLINFEYGILSVLHASEGQTLRMNDLGCAVSSPAPRLSKAVSRLEARGLVERITGACEDGRAILVRLTDDGRRAWRDATPAHIAFARDTLLAGLTPEQLTDLARLLDPVLRHLDPERALGRPPTQPWSTYAAATTTSAQISSR